MIKYFCDKCGKQVQENWSRFYVKEQDGAFVRANLSKLDDNCDCCLCLKCVIKILKTDPTPKDK